MSDVIDYGNLMHRAMRGLIQDVLNGVAANGLPGDHHFFITFDALHPDVEMADWLSDRYPGEMTVVIQHWFDNLDVSAEGFAITLNFGDSPEPLYIPYDAIKTFVDPSVEFGLRFEGDDSDEQEEILGPTPVAAMPKPVMAPQVKSASPPTDSDGEDPAKPADVVSLDSFRKP